MADARAWPQAAAVIFCVLPIAVSAGASDRDTTIATGLKLTKELASPTDSPTRKQDHVLGQLLVIEINLNGVRKGDFTVFATPNGDFLLGESDLKEMGVQAPYGTPVVLEGEPRFSLRALQARDMRFDEATLALFVSLPPERLPTKSLDLQSGRPQRMLEPNDNSAFFNYRAFYFGDNAGGPANLTLSTELGVRVGGYLLRSESAHARGNSLSQNIRYSTNLTHDNRRTLQRWTLGDFSATSGDLGGVLNLGGVSFSKSYQIDPYLIRQPMASFIGNITSPAQAEIYLDGVRVRTETLQPGQFALRNLNYYGGQREITVVIRDRLGRETTLAYPFYFTDANLREGLHEYSYNLGFQRENLGITSNDYGKLALSAFHRYGISDNLTLGGRGEAEAGRFNVGTMAALRMDNVGVVSGSLSAGRNQTGKGWAGVARYTYQAHQFSGQAELRRTSPQYETIGQSATADRPKTEMSASASYGTPLIGSLSLDWRQLRQYQGSDQRSVSLGYSRNLFGSVSLQASISRVNDTSDATASNIFFLALTYSPKRDVTTNFFHSQQAGTSRDVLQFGTNTPVGEGVGYRIVSERNSSDGAGAGYRFAPSLQYNGQHGVYTADFVSSRSAGGASQLSYQLGVGGSIAYVADTLAFSRPVTDSFGIVKVGELEGVRVYHSSQEIGRTDSTGKVFLPNLGSYVSNGVAIDDRDIPIDYLIAEKELNISPPLRSGSFIRFDLMRIQATTGKLSVRIAGQAQPVEYLDLHITSDGKEVTAPTGRGGEFYIENLAPGRHAARFVLGERRCNFELTIPSSQEMLIDLGELHVCQFDR